MSSTVKGDGHMITREPWLGRNGQFAAGDGLLATRMKGETRPRLRPITVRSVERGATVSLAKSVIRCAKRHPRLCQLLCPPNRQMGTFAHSQPHATIAVKLFCFSSNVENRRIVFGRPPALGAGGLRFKSGRPDQILLNQKVTEAQFRHCCIVVQLGNNRKNSQGKTALQASPKLMETVRAGAGPLRAE
jgi:hypothetical protein